MRCVAGVPSTAKARWRVSMLAASLVVGLGAAPPLSAEQAPGGGTTARGPSPEVIVGTLSARFDDTLPGGGVVAEGAGYAGREDGNANTSAAITIAGIPAGATVQRALLYWAISGGVDTTATINAVAVTGVLLGTGGDACWGVNNSTFRADVTAQVAGNGVYTIGGLPSSTVATGADTDGVALVVVYQDPAAASVRRVMIRDGVITTSGSGEVVVDTFAGLLPPSATTGRFHIVVGDGQAPPDGNLIFNGTTIGTDQFPGSDGSMMDVRSYNVSIPALLANATWSHNTAGDCLLFETAVLDYDVPQSADLSVAKTDGQTTAVPGQPVSYTITVANAGPSAVIGATVTDTIPAALLGATWTCAPSAGAVCTASGAGNINDGVVIPVGGSLTYTLTGSVHPEASGTLVNTATVAVPGGVTDPDPLNDSAADTDPLVPAGLFIEGELNHGSGRWHDLAAPPGPAGDTDLFRILQRPHASYEVLLDGASGDIGSGPLLELVASDGSTVLQTSAPAGVGGSRSLRFMNALDTPVADEYVRVRSAGCTTECDAQDVYRLSALETTGFITRFNNSGTQITVLVLQNLGNVPLDLDIRFWNGAGAPAGSVPNQTLGPRGTYVLNTLTVAPGSGSISVANTGRYGQLAGKAVAVEPATGFTFDTALAQRPK